MNISNNASSPPTQRLIAVAAGVSRETVSHILGGASGHRYSEETQTKVRETAARLGYQPNLLARAIRKGRSNLIGVIQAGGNLELARRAHNHFVEEIHHHGFDSLSVDITRNSERILNSMIQSRVEGVVVSMMHNEFGLEDAERFQRAGIPVISVFGHEYCGVPSVRDELVSGYYHLTQHLQEIGHRRLLLLTESFGTSERSKGFELAMKGFGPVQRMTTSEFLSEWPKLSMQSKEQACGFIVSVDGKRVSGTTSETFYEFGKSLYSNRLLPDACLCSNDQKAFGMFAAALEMGISIPRDMALTGTDNDAFGAFPAFGLTTVHLDVKRACTTAVAHLTSLIRNEPKERRQLVFQPSLVLRTSCGRSIAPGENREARVEFPPLSILKNNP